MPVMSGGNIMPGAIRRSGALSAESTAGDPVVYGALRWVRADYSFATDAGAVGTLALIGTTAIPAGAIVLGGLLEVTTPPTSGGAATIAVQVEAANDTVAAAAVSGAPWSTTGRKSVIPVFTGATSLKTTAARDVSIVIGTAALTAGGFTVYLAYIATA
jgi:hypothetical protein